MQHTHHVSDTSHRPTVSSKSPQRTLTMLSAMGFDELRSLYAAGTAPLPFSVLDGDPKGRMLAIRSMDRGAIGSIVRGFATGIRFPWEGKTFESQGPESGSGINRIAIAGRHQLFRFTTHVAASVMDGAPTMVLDYDNNDNPGLIRRIHDELRNIGEGLFLGPACWKAKSGPVALLWFAIATTQAAQA